MKQLNFLSKSGSQSGSHRVVTLDTTVGSPSAHRRGAMLKLISVLVLILTIGVGQMWGVDATMGGGNACTVNGNTAKRAGTSNAAGSMTITVPNGATVLSFYCAAWSGESPTVSITPVAKVGDSSFGPSADSGISGSGSSFTLSGTESSYLRSITLNSITSETTLTFANSAKKKRFVVWSPKYVFNPTSPTNGEIGSTTASLSWSYGNSTDKYEVYYSTTNSAPNADTTPSVSSSTIGTTKSVTLTGLTSSQQYYWWVRAVDDYCKSAWVAGTSFTTAASGCTNKVNITNSTTTNVTNGSFTVDKTGEQNACSALSVTVTPTPATHYHVVSVSATNPATSGTAGAANDNGDGTYTITYSENAKGNTTISVTFDEDIKYTLNYHDGSGDGTKTNVYEGTNLISALGTPAASCDATSTTFQGWSTAEIVTKTNTAPTFVAANAVVNSTTAADTYYAVYAKLGSETSIMGGNIGSGVGETGWTASHNSWYSGNGYKFQGTTYYIQSSDISSFNHKSVTVKLKAGYNTTSGSVLTIASLDANSDVIDSKTFTPTENWDSQSTTYSFELNGNSTIKYVKISMSNKAGNVGMKYCEVFYTPLSDYMTTCCTPLGQINGSINLAQKSATLSWDLEDAQNGGIDHINSWKVEYKLSSAENWTVAESELAKATLTKTISDLNCNTDYDFRVSANVQSGYCDIVKEWTSQKTTKFTITKDETGGGGITLSPAATSVCDGDVIDVTADTPDGSHEGTGTIKVVETGSDPENDVTSTVYNSGTGKLTMPAYNITISATYTEKSSPSVGVSVAALNFGTPKKDASVAAQTFNLTGSALTVGTLTLVAPSGYTVSPSSITIASAGNLSATEITVTPNTGTAGNFDGNISISGAGVSSTNIVALTMTVQETYTVNWYVNGTDNAHKARTQTDIVNTALTGIPSDFSGVTDCSEKVFMGWTEDDDYTHATDAPADLITSTTGMKITAANKNYYAVFADQEGEDANSWDLVTNASSLQENDIITFTSTCEYTYSKQTYKDTVAYAGKSGDLGAVVPIGITNNQIREVKEEGTIREIKLEAGSTDGTWKLYDLTDKYLTEGDKKITYAETSGDVSISITSGAATVKFGTSSYSLQYNPNNNAGTYSSARMAFYSSAQKGIQIYKKTETSATYSNYVTVCPHVSRVTLSAPEVSNGSISFEQSGSAVTSVRTDGDDAVVDVVASPNTGYELTGLTLTSDDVTGATKNQALTQITIPEDEEGTLTVTATFAQKNYSIAVETYPASIGATLTGVTSTAKYGVEQTISTNEPTGYIFGGWYMYDAEDTGKETDLSEELFTGTYAGEDLELEASFLMPDKNLVAEAYFDEIHDVAWALENTPSSGSSAKVYVKGLISKIDSYQSNTITYWISDNGQHVNGTVLEVFKGKGVDNDNFTAIDNLTVGDEVIVYGQLTTYGGTKEFGTGNYLYSRTAASLSSVVVSAPDASLVKTEYFGTTETFSYAGLKATAEYNTGYQKDVTDDATWKANGSASLTVTTGGTVNVTATYGGETSSNYGVTVTVTTKTLESITVSPAALTGYKGQALPKPTTVTANFDDQGVASSSNVTAQAVYDEAGDYSASSTSAQTIAVKYTFGPTTKSANYTVTLSSVANTVGTAYSVEKAQEIIELDKADGNDLDLELAANKAYVIGRVKSVTALTGSNAGKYTIVLEDQTDNTKTIELFRSTYGTGITSVEVGDVIKAYGNLYWYAGGSKYEINEGGQVVWKQPKVDIQIANKTLEVGDVWTIAATIDPAAAPVTYSIKDGSDDCVTLATNVITATAEGTATIIASAEAYDDGVNTYAANSKEFTVTVSPAKVHTDVIILAEYNGHYYALNNTAGTTEVQFENGMVIVPDQATKMAILWDRAEREGVATFYNATASKFLNGGTSTALGMETEEGTYISWTWVETETKAYYTSNSGASARTFMYMNGQAIKNYAVSNIGNGSYAQANVYAGAVAVKISSNTDVSDLPENASVLVEEGVTLTVDAESTLDNLIVENGGKVTLSSNKLTVVGTFSIETTMAGGNSGQLEGATASNFEASEAYIDITLGAGGTNQQWHAFTVPFPVDVMSGIYDLDDNKLNNEVNYAIMEYFGDERAKGNYGWKKIRTTLVPGTFYIMATDGKRTTYRFKKKAGAALVAENSKEIFKFAASGDGVSTDAGWNGVGNPTLTYGKVGVEVQVLDPGSYTFVKKDANSTNFVVGTPFFYQAAAAGSISMLEANAGASYAPRRVAANGFEKIKVAFGNEEFTDYLDVSASEEALNEYQIGKDLAKMTMTNTPKVAQIFGKAYNTKLCMVHAPMVNNQAEVALELYAPQAGTYTISVPTEREDASLYLTKDGNIIWDLTMSPYEAEFGKGATEGYGLMLVRKAPQVTTGVETIDNSQFTIRNCQKVILNDHVYILRDGQLYDVTGKAVK